MIRVLEEPTKELKETIKVIMQPQRKKLEKRGGKKKKTKSKKKD